MTTFALPDLGEGLTEAEIVAWHVSPGDHVIADQPLVSIETDKAVVEVPSPWSGTVEKTYGGPGDVLKIGAALAEIGTGGAEDKGAIVGEVAEPDREITAGPADAVERTPSRGAGVSAAPAVRQLARRLGVDLSAVTGTGPGGAILSADVEAAGEGEALRGVRRAMAKAMTASGAAVVPATLTDRVDISGWGKDADPTLRLIRAICRASAAEPSLNARFDGTRRTVRERVDLSVAVDTPDGLFAPVLKSVDTLSPGGLAARLEALKVAARDRSLTPADLSGGTITLSNFGILGGEYAVLVVTPPQVAILGAGRIHDAVLAVGGVPAVRRILPLSLTFDHRAVTGGEAARFMAAVCSDLEAPE
ncbi:MAG: 2-oxo acid dehydrogenase subunit E2 [Paracoccaceae bacterium]|nr:2-oxo acid dehydrogenase subunit E2 [Paracoccaceae bacterium]